jgi:hypothetical protein
MAGEEVSEMKGDLADKAQQVNELFQKEALEKRKTPGPKAKGECYYCEEPLEPGQRWCDNDCRDDWQREIKAIGRRG